MSQFDSPHNPEFWNHAGKILSGESKPDSMPDTDLNSLKDIWDLSASYQYVGQTNTDAQWLELQNKINSTAQSSPLKVSHRSRNIRWAAAACVALVAFGAGYFFLGKGNSANYEVAIFHYQGKPGTTTEVKLPDGSSVSLRGNSTLDVAADFGKNNRAVSLVGEGKFEIAKDAERPFIVQAAGTKTTVLGTGFDIHALSKGKVKIQVLHGKVSFASASDASKEKVLEIGEGATYTAASNSVESENNAGIADWTKGIIRFSGTSLLDVNQEFEASFGRTLLLPAGAEKMQYSGTMVVADGAEAFAKTLSNGLRIPIAVR